MTDKNNPVASDSTRKGSEPWDTDESSTTGVTLSNKSVVEIDYKSHDFIREFYDQHRDKCFFGLCSNSSELDKIINRIIEMIYKNINISDRDKEILLIRYIGIVKKIERKYKRHARYFSWASIFTNTASILVTALISINNIDRTNETTTQSLWWASWILSLLISIVTTLGSFYKWDRKYLLLYKVYTKLEQEIWMFLELVGPYRVNSNTGDGHHEKLPAFYARLELINKRANDNLIDIEEEQEEKDIPKQAAAKKDPVAEDVISIGTSTKMSPSQGLISPSTNHAKSTNALLAELENERNSQLRTMRGITTREHMPDKKLLENENLILKSRLAELERRLTHQTLMSPMTGNMQGKNLNAAGALFSNPNYGITSELSNRIQRTILETNNSDEESDNTSQRSNATDDTNDTAKSLYPPTGGIDLNTVQEYHTAVNIENSENSNPKVKDILNNKPRGIDELDVDVSELAIPVEQQNTDKVI